MVLVAPDLAAKLHASLLEIKQLKAIIEELRRELSEYGAGRILLSSLQVLPANQIKHHQNQLPDERQNQSSDEHQVATIMTYKILTKTNHVPWSKNTAVYGEFTIKNTVIQKGVLIINQVIENFIKNATQLGAQQLTASNQSLTSLIEQDVQKRLVAHIPSGVIVKEM